MDSVKKQIDIEFEDSSWDTVGERIEGGEIFSPLEMKSMKTEAIKADEFFPDYSESKEEIESDVRWHLPRELSIKAVEGNGQEEEEQVKTTALTDEEIEKLKREAFEAGKQLGLNESEGRYKEQLGVLENMLTSLLNDLQVQMKEHQEECEKQAVELALEISKRIVNFAVEISPEYIHQIIDEALVKAGAAKIIKIRLSPQDMEFIEVIGWDKKREQEFSSFTFEVDENIRSGCVVETSAGEIDFQLDEAWERVKENVIKAIR